MTSFPTNSRSLANSTALRDEPVLWRGRHLVGVHSFLLLLDVVPDLLAERGPLPCRPPKSTHQRRRELRWPTPSQTNLPKLSRQLV
jgi:hypothetical protein